MIPAFDELGLDTRSVGYKPSAVARACGLSRSTIYKLVKTGHLRSVHPPGTEVVLITRESLEHYLAQWAAPDGPIRPARGCGRPRASKPEEVA